MNEYDYFQSYTDYFWQWEDNNEVIAIPAGYTIAHNKFVEDALEKLTPQGLPPFGSLLLAICATNPDGSNALDTVYSLMTTTLQTTDDSTLTQAIAFLKMVADVPKIYKEGNKRILLLQALFEGCHNIAATKKSFTICKEYKNSSVIGKAAKKMAFDNSQFREDFRTIALLNAKFQGVDDIIQKIASIPDITSEVLELETSSNEEEHAPVDFVDELIQNSRTFTVGSLIRHLWGGLNIPVHSVLPSQQPLGGVSDLTNKGDLDKLLISEFANDDLIFLSRLANNEALYIHREIPPSNHNRERIVLIDVSLKNWGTPKAVAFAVMLAIARHPKTDVACSSFVVGDSCQPIYIDNVDNVISGLQLLEGSLNASRGLSKFLKEHATENDKEIFFITEPSTVKQPELAKVLNEYHGAIAYLIHTDADGHIDIYKKNRNSKRHVQHIKLPLDNLWKKDVQEKVKNIQHDLSYPILFTGPFHTKKVITAPDGAIFQLTRDRVLLRLFGDSKKGWELISEKLPFTTERYGIGINDSGNYVVLLFNPRDKTIVLHNTFTKKQIILLFDQWKHTQLPDFIFYGGEFLHYNGGHIWSISLDGKIILANGVSITLFNQRQSVLTDLALKFNSNTNIFKNIQRIYIGVDGSLMFNIHVLQINNHGHIKLVATNKMPAKIEAGKNEDEFEFPDSSTVCVNRAGMLILKSSNPDIPIIYIPTTLNSSLGLATDKEFAGNEYYYKDEQFQITCTKPGRNKSATINVLRAVAGFTLSDCAALTEKSPVVIGNFSKQNKMLIETALKNDGAEIEITSLNHGTTSLQKIDTRIFFEKYIGEYIKTIVQHGTKPKTAS